MYSLTKRLLLLSLAQTILLTPFLKAAPTPQTPRTFFARLNAQETPSSGRFITFTPPSGWLMADSKQLPSSVKVMFVGKGKKSFPPSINLGTEAYQGTLGQYIKTIEAINETQGGRWNALGTLKTPAGSGNLYQEDSKTKWGDVRMLHFILQQDGVIYMLTAAANREEFADYYQPFLEAIGSLSFVDHIDEQVKAIGT